VASLVDPGVVSVSGFRPSAHGFRFANRFPPGPTVVLGPLDVRYLGFGDASAGLCGGMALTVRDLFEAGVPVPPDDGPPANGSPRFRSLVRRQVQSLDWLRVPARFWAMQALDRDPARTTVEREWPRVRATIDAGHLAVLGLVRTTGLSPWGLAVNHQVLAYAYAIAPDGVTVWIYDPNHPARDDVALVTTSTAATAGIRQSTGEPVRGWLALPWRRGSVRVWASA
jgi:hypothetical protein